MSLRIDRGSDWWIIEQHEVRLVKKATRVGSVLGRHLIKNVKNYQLDRTTSDIMICSIIILICHNMICWYLHNYIETAKDIWKNMNSY